MNPNATDKRVTVRMLEAYFSGINILIDYMNALNNATARRVHKKFLKEVEKIERQSTSLDQSEAVFGFAAYLLRNQKDLNEQNPEMLKRNIAIMASKFCKANNLAQPGIGYAQRLVMPSDGASEKTIIQ